MSNRCEYLLNPLLNVPATVAKAEKLAARAQKKGLAGGFKIFTETRVETLLGQPFERTYLVIEGKPVAYSGWTFVAKVEWVNGQPVVTGSPWYEGPQVDRSTLVQGACDHCGYNRRRTAVVVVENADGDRKQVGKQCLKDYLGQELTPGWFSEDDTFESLGGYDGNGLALSNLLHTLTWAACVVRTHGFVPARDENRATTKSLVSLALEPRPSNRYRAELWEELQNSLDLPVDNAQAQKILDFARGLEGDSDYVQNVRAVLATEDGFYNPKYDGLVVSLAGVYAREVEKQAREQAAPVVEEEYGKVGERVTVTLTAVSSRAFDSAYGTTYANTFTGEGHRFKWLTGTRSFETGETITVKATIKGYDEWDGRKFTVLTRCKEVTA